MPTIDCMKRGAELLRAPGVYFPPHHSTAMRLASGRSRPNFSFFAFAFLASFPEQVGRRWSAVLENPSKRLDWIFQTRPHISRKALSRQRLLFLGIELGRFLVQPSMLSTLHLYISSTYSTVTLLARLGG